MSRFRHLWGVARHRLPLHIYDLLGKLKENNNLKIISGNLIDMTEKDGRVKVIFYNKKKIKRRRK
jgi:hypothetical protein